MDKSTLQIVLTAKDDLSKELIKVQKELSKLSKEFNKGKTTSKRAADSITKDLKKIDDEATDVRGGIKKLVGTFQGLGAMRLFGAIGALLAFRQAMMLVKTAMFKAADFEKVMSDVNTLFNDSGEKVAELEQGIKSMVKSMPIDPNELGKAAYQIVSAGISDTSEALLVLEASGKLATAGLSTTAEAADILTSAVNTFSKDGLTSAQIANVIFKTVKAGKTTVAELAQAFGATAPIVAELGVKFIDFQAATAALTTTGLPAAQAQNAIRGAMSALMKPTGEMEELLNKVAKSQGKTSMTGRELIASSGNLGNAFSLLRKEATKNNLSIEEAFGRVESLNAVFGLTGSVASSYADTLKSVSDETDLLTEGFLKQQATMTAQWQLVKNKVNVAMIDLGAKVFPMVLKVINTGIGAVESLTEMWSKHKDFIKTYVVPVMVGVVALFTTLFVAGKIQAITWAGTVGGAFASVNAMAIGLITTLRTLLATMLAIPGLNLAVAIGVIATAFVGLMGKIKQTNDAVDKQTESMIASVDMQINILKQAQDMNLIAEAATNEKVKELLKERASIRKRIGQGETGSTLKEARARVKILEEEIEKSPQAKLELAQLTGGDVSGMIEEMAQAEEVLKDSKKEYDNFGKDISKIWITLQLAHEKSIEKITLKLAGLGEEYTEVQVKGSDAVAKLKENSAKSLKDIDNSISSVTQSMADLTAEFEKTKVSDRQGVGQAFVDAEASVKSLKNELSRATDSQQILDIKGQIKTEEDALSKSAEVRKQFSVEIAEAQRRAGLSGIQKAVEDFNSKRELAQTEFNAKMADLEAEKQALIQKRALEKQMYLDKIEDQKISTLLKLKSILDEKVALLQQQKEEVTLFQQKEEAILALVSEAQAERLKITMDAHAQTEEAVEAEIQLYKDLATAIKQAASASAGSLIAPSSFGGMPTMGGRATGGPIQQSGMYNLHQGEYILNRRESRGGGGSVVNLNGGVYLSEQVAEQIGDMIINKLKTNMKL